MRSKFYYITRLRDMGENSKIDFFQVFHSKLYTVAAPLIAALDYRPLLNRSRKIRGLDNIF